MMTENGEVHKPRGRRPGVAGEFFDDLEVIDKKPVPHPLAAPEPLKKVKVLPPYLCAYADTQYWPDETAEVPESVGNHWLTQKWVAECT